MARPPVFEHGRDAVRLSLSREGRDAQVDTRHSLQCMGNGKTCLSGAPDWLTSHAAAAVDQKMQRRVHSWNWGIASEYLWVIYEYLMQIVGAQSAVSAWRCVSHARCLQHSLKPKPQACCRSKSLALLVFGKWCWRLAHGYRQVNLLLLGCQGRNSAEPVGKLLAERLGQILFGDANGIALIGGGSLAWLFLLLSLRLRLSLALVFRLSRFWCLPLTLAFSLFRARLRLLVLFDKLGNLLGIIDSRPRIDTTSILFLKKL